MFVESEISIPQRICGSCFLRIDEPEVVGVGSALKTVGIRIEPTGVIDQAIRLSNRGDDRLVLGSLSNRIDTLLPLPEAFELFFFFLNNIFVSGINCFLGFNSRDR